MPFNPLQWDEPLHFSGRAGAVAASCAGIAPWCAWDVCVHVEIQIFVCQKVQVGKHLLLSIPREVWLQGRASKADELFWQVWVALPAQLIFRGFPISLKSKHDCGRILLLCFLNMGI